MPFFSPKKHTPTILLPTSLNRLSPSRMDDTRLGTFTNFKMALVLTASGGETIPPSRKPKAREKPGIKALATNATAKAERNTTKKAKLPIIRLHFHSSFHDIAHEASNSKGGKKIIKIKSGSICNTGMPGIKLMNSPASTSKIG